MKTKVLLFSLLFSGLFLLVFILVVFLFHKKTANKIAREPSVELNLIRKENALLREGFFHSYDYSFIPIPLTETITDFFEKPTSLQTLVRDKSTLILLANPLMCSPCVPIHVKAIFDFANQKRVNIIIGIEGLSSRQFQAFVSQNQIEKYAFLLPEGFYSGLQISPIVYFVSKNGIQGFFYAPSDNFPELTQDYFDVIVTKL